MAPPVNSCLRFIIRPRYFIVLLVLAAIVDDLYLNIRFARGGFIALFGGAPFFISGFFFGLGPCSADSSVGGERGPVAAGARCVAAVFVVVTPFDTGGAGRSIVDAGAIILTLIVFALTAVLRVTEGRGGTSGQEEGRRRGNDKMNVQAQYSMLINEPRLQLYATMSRQ